MYHTHYCHESNEKVQVLVFFFMIVRTLYALWEKSNNEWTWYAHDSITSKYWIEMNIQDLDLHDSILPFIFHCYLSPLNMMIALSNLIKVVIIADSKRNYATTFNSFFNSLFVVIETMRCYYFKSQQVFHSVFIFIRNRFTSFYFTHGYVPLCHAWIVRWSSFCILKTTILITLTRFNNL